EVYSFEFVVSSLKLETTNSKLETSLEQQRLMP
ncbi:MAG: hypothetical protein RLZZ292_696, partial [Bacteroidota bacterium]